MQTTWDRSRLQKLFLICPSPYPRDRTASNNSPPTGQKSWTCPGGYPGGGVVTRQITETHPHFHTRESVSRYRRPLRRCMRINIPRSANAKYHYILPFRLYNESGRLTFDVFLWFLVWIHRFSRSFCYYGVPPCNSLHVLQGSHNKNRLNRWIRTEKTQEYIKGKSPLFFEDEKVEYNDI